MLLLVGAAFCLLRRRRDGSEGARATTKVKVSLEKSVAPPPPSKAVSSSSSSSTEREESESSSQRAYPAMIMASSTDEDLGGPAETSSKPEHM